MYSLDLLLAETVYQSKIANRNRLLKIPSFKFSYFLNRKTIVMSTTTLTNNASVVAKLYEAFGRGDIPYIVGHLDENAAWIAAGEGSLPHGGTYKGKEVSTFFQRMLNDYEFNSFNPNAIHNISEDEVVAFGDMTVTNRHSGKQASSNWAMHMRFNENGKMVYFQDFFDTAAVYRTGL